MGASAEVWSEELRRTGRVVFPIRWSTVAFRCFLPGVPIGIGVFTRPEPSLGWAEDLVSNSLVIVWLGLVGLGVWHLVTGRPEVTVDRDGVRVGRRRFLPWDGMAPIYVPRPDWFAEVRLLPTNPGARKLTIGRDQVRDVPAFARWLEDERLAKGAAWQ